MNLTAILLDTNTVVLTASPLTKAGNVAASAVELHVDSDYLIAERLSPHTWQLIPVGKVGETVITAVTGEVVASIGL